MKIKDLPKVDRPREKLEKYGQKQISYPPVGNTSRKMAKLEALLKKYLRT